jgi:post-segregation antitoxin (ccd killing protein)
MGTLRATLRLSSSDVLSTTLDLNVSVNVEADSGSIQRAKVLGVSAGSDAHVIHKANEKLNSSYLYIKNLDAVRENYLYVYEEGATDDPVIVKLAGGEFAFVPVDPTADLKAYGTKVDQIMEFGSFGLDSSAVRYS